MIGGKDSLVAWHLARTQGLHPVLLYVADGMEEFENNWRLNEIVRSIGTDIHIGKYGILDFQIQFIVNIEILFFLLLEEYSSKQADFFLPFHSFPSSCFQEKKSRLLIPSSKFHTMHFP